MAHVLIGYGEALPAAEVVFSLRAAGHDVSIFARNDDLPIRRLDLAGFHVVPPPEENLAASEDAVRSLVDGVDVVLPLDDSALFVVSRALGEDSRIAGATGEQARVALDKEAQVLAAEAARLDVPPTWILRGDGEVASLTGSARGRDVPYPAIAKPALAGEAAEGRFLRGDASYLNSASDLADMLERHRDGSPVLVQPLVHGVGEGVFGHRTEKGVEAWSGHQRLRMMNPHGSGSSACQSLVPDDGLRARIENFLDRIGWRGPFMVELLRDADGTPHFMEINGRMWGSMALARRQGLEYPAWAVARTLGKEPAHFPEASEDPLTVRHLGRELLHLAFVLKGPRSDFHKETWPSLPKSLAGVLSPAKGRAFYNHDPSAKAYFLRDAMWTVRKAFRR